MENYIMFMDEQLSVLRFIYKFSIVLFNNLRDF
jgi:hypothetical protein